MSEEKLSERAIRIAVEMIYDALHKDSTSSVSLILGSTRDFLEEKGVLVTPELKEEVDRVLNTIRVRI